MTIDELAVLDGDRCILQLRGVSPFLSDKYDVTKHPLYQETGEYDDRNKSVLHIADHHPDAYNDVLIELKDTITSPDFIISDGKHENTGLVIKKIESSEKPDQHTFIVLKICTDSQNGQLANSIISGWKISDKRLQSYLRNKQVLYKKEKS